MSKPADVFSSPINPLFSSGVGDRKETFISFQQFSKPPAASVASPWSIAGGPGLIVENNSSTNHIKRKLASNTPGNRDNPSLLFYASEYGSEITHLPPEKRKRANAKFTLNDENSDKLAGRKRNGNKGRYKEVQTFPITNQTDIFQSDSLPAEGILGMFGLNTKQFESPRYMDGTPSEHFIFDQPAFLQKQDIQMKNIVDKSFGTDVSLGLQNMIQALGGEVSKSMPKSVDSRPQKIMLDLNALDSELLLIGETEENALPDTNKPFSSGRLNMVSLESRTLHDLPMQFLPSDSLDGLIQKLGGVPLGNRITSYKMIDPSHDENMSSLPSQPSSFSSGQAFQHENLCDKFVKNKMDHYRVKYSEMYDSKTELLQNPIGNRLASSVNSEITESKCVDKPTICRADWFDIDLNKQCAEATEDCESMIETTLTETVVMLPETSSLVPCKPIIEENDSLITVESSTNILEERQPSDSVPMYLLTSSGMGQATVVHCSVNNAMFPDEEFPNPLLHTAKLKIEKKDVENNQDSGSHSMCETQIEKLSLNMDELTTVKDDVEKNPEVSESQMNARDTQESRAICDSQVENNPAASIKNESEKQESESSVSECPPTQSSSEVIENVPPTSVSVHRSGIQIPMLSSTCGQESEEIWDEVPYSPGMQATAHLLCKMAMSSSPFYIDNGNEERDNDHSIQQASEAPNRQGAFEFGMQASKEKNIRRDDDLCKIPLKGYQSREGKDRILPTSNSKASSSMLVNEKTKGLVVSRESGFKSRGDTVNKVCGKGNNQQYVAGSKKFLTGLFTKEEGKGKLRVESSITKFVLTSQNKSSSLVQRKTEREGETKQSVHGGVLGKVSRPRSRSGKSSLSSQKVLSSNNVKLDFPMKTPARQSLSSAGKTSYKSK